MFVGASNVLWCLNATTGALIWSYTTGGDIVSCPAIAGGRVYVGSYDRNVYCIDCATGIRDWNVTTGGWVVALPAVVGGYVYVGSDQMYCLGASTGSPYWKYTTNNAILASPAVSAGRVYQGDIYGTFYCWNATTGTIIWVNDYHHPGPSSVVLANGLLYVGCSDSRVCGIDAISGTFLWDYATNGFIANSLAVANGCVYASSADHSVYCLPMILTIPASPYILRVNWDVHTPGDLTFYWTSVAGATSYAFYQSVSFIQSTSSATAIEVGLTATTFQDILTVNGTYYFAVVALNANGSSPVSNNFQVTVAIPPTNGIPQWVAGSVSTTIQCRGGGTNLADLTLNTTRPVTITLNGSTTPPANVSLPNAVGYLQINCNDPTAIIFPITLTFYYNASEVVAQDLNASQLGVWYFNSSGEWEFLGGTVNPADHSVTVTLTHFSTYVVAKIPAPPPANGNGTPSAVIANFFAIGVGLSLLCIAIISVVAIVDYSASATRICFRTLKQG